jgi:hypothetical protein
MNQSNDRNNKKMFRQIAPATGPKSSTTSTQVKINSKNEKMDPHKDFIPLRSGGLVPRKYTKKAEKKISRYQENVLLKKGNNIEYVQEFDPGELLANISPISFTLSDYKSSESGGNSLTSLNLDKESLSLSDTSTMDYESLSKLVSSQDLEDFLLFEQNEMNLE